MAAHVLPSETWHLELYHVDCHEKVFRFVIVTELLYVLQKKYSLHTKYTATYHRTFHRIWCSFIINLWDCNFSPFCTIIFIMYLQCILCEEKYENVL